MESASSKKMKKKNFAYYIKATYGLFSDKVGRISRKKYRNRRDIQRLRNTDFTLFSQNCIGSIMSHDLELQFRSPTVNLLFTPKDFITFMKNVSYYLEQEIVFEKSNLPYPVGKIGGVEIKFLHYHSEKEAEELWNRRKQRINWDNVFVICCDEGLTESDMIEYDNLPYEHKILFVSKPHPEIKSAVVCDMFTDYTDAKLLEFANPFGKRYYSNYIDYVAWLNGDDYIRKKNICMIIWKKIKKTGIEE